MHNTFAQAEMLIRRPRAEVFDAFVKPEMIVKFWLDSASAALGKGVTVKWKFMVPGAEETVTVTEFIENQCIAFRWSDGIKVDMDFREFARDQTRLTVTARGFGEAQDAEAANKATEGFSIVLCDLKSLLETGSSGNMVRDKAALIAEAKNTARP